MEHKYQLKNGNQLILPTIIEGNYANHWKPEGFTNEDHHFSYEAISSSGLKDLLISPYTYLRNTIDRQNGIGKKPSRSMKFGTIAHMMILEPELFRKKFQIMPNFGDQRKKENQLEKELWELSLDKDAVVFKDNDEFDDFVGVIEAIASHQKCKNLFKEGVSERSGFYKDPVTGLLCRIRPDFISTREDLNLFLDLKTAKSSAYRKFQADAWTFRYDLQIAMYREGFKEINGYYPDNCLWVVVENKKPYEVAVYEIDFKLIEVSTEWYRFGLDRLSKCIKTMNFPQRQTVIEKMGLPDYALFENVPTHLLEDNKEE